jgi:hypothetical protein
MHSPFPGMDPYLEALVWDESHSWIGLKANRRACTDRAIISPQLLDLQRRGDTGRVERHLAYFFFHINDL